MTSVVTRPAADPDADWRAEFRALLLEIDKLAVALDVRRWRRAVPGSTLSVIEHLILLRARWRAVPVVAPTAFVREEAPAAAGGETALATRPAVLLRTWRREGWAFPERLDASYRRAGGRTADEVKRQYLAELAALRRCLAAFRAVASADAGAHQAGQ
jgi:hypothetical protein